MEGERIAKSLGIYQEKYKGLLQKQKRDPAAAEPDEERKQSSVDAAVRKVRDLYAAFTNLLASVSLPWESGRERETKEALAHKRVGLSMEPLL